MKTNKNPRWVLLAVEMTIYDAMQNSDKSIPSYEMMEYMKTDVFLSSVDRYYIHLEELEYELLGTSIEDELKNLMSSEYVVPNAEEIENLITEIYKI
jgi:hypothetical protein